MADDGLDAVDNRPRRGDRRIRGRGGRDDNDTDKDKYAGTGGEFETLKSDGPGPQKCTPVFSYLAVEGWIVFVTGVNDEAAEEDILDKFAEKGEVKNLHMNLDRRTGYVKGYALIEYANRSEAEAAINDFDNTEFLGTKIHVDWTFTTGQNVRRGSRK